MRRAGITVYGIDRQVYEWGWGCKVGIIYAVGGRGEGGRVIGLRELGVVLSLSMRDYLTYSRMELGV